jgi:hypothetical protein
VEQQPQALAAPESRLSLKSLYRIAGASFMLASILYVWALVAQLLLPTPGFAEDVLQYVARNRNFFALSYAFFTVANSLSIIGVFGLFQLARTWNRSYAILGAGAMVIGLVATLFSNATPAFISLSDRYSAATSDAERLAYSTAAAAVGATNNPLIAAAFIGVGVVFVSLTMFSGPFGRVLGYLGVVVGVFNILRALPYLSGYPFVTSSLFVAVSSVWIFGVGYKVYKQGSSA